MRFHGRWSPAGPLTEGGFFPSAPAGRELAPHSRVPKPAAAKPREPTGNPIPGRFDYKDTHSQETVYPLDPIPLSGFGSGELFIAAHAVLLNTVTGDGDRVGRTH